MTFRNRLNILLFGEYFDVIPSTRICRDELNLRHAYDLSKEEYSRLNYRSVWIDKKGNRYKCKYLRMEPLDIQGRIINY